MAANDFFSRWARRENETAQQGSRPASDANVDADAEGTQAETPRVPPPPPTMADVAELTVESDYSRFVADGVDESVKRSAMKKLFSDPHFNVMDGLDIYIGDYSQPDPIPPAMLAMLNHAKALLDPLSQFEKPMMGLVQAPPQESPAATPEALEAAAAPDAAQEPGAEARVRAAEPETSAAAPASIGGQDGLDPSDAAGEGTFAVAPEPRQPEANQLATAKDCAHDGGPELPNTAAGSPAAVNPVAANPAARNTLAG